VNPGGEMSTRGPKPPPGERILGHGIDLTPCARIEEMIERHADRFLERIFTDGERAYAGAARKRRAERFAVRFAAKEAAMKALGTGWSRGISWTDIEVVQDAAGAPGLALHARGARIAREQGVRRWLVSLSHTEDLAIASVLALGDGVS